MRFQAYAAIAGAMLASASPITRKFTCDSSKLNTTTSVFDVTVANTTVFEIARLTNRGVCDIGRHNLMADVTIVPNVGQTILIPEEVCDPDNHTCLLDPNGPRTMTCIRGGPRLYYTVNGDTYEKVATRLNITTEAFIADAADGDAEPDELMEVGQLVKVPLCDPSTCTISPYTFDKGVYKDIAEIYGTTVGQLMMLSPTYNYSTYLSGVDTSSAPSIDMMTNCTLGTTNGSYSVLS